MADRDIDGATFVRAYALGVDVAARLRLATTAMLNETGFATNTYAPFAAATAAAVIFGLDHQQTYDALGWAYAQCAGSVQAQQSSGSTLHVHHGLAASTGLQAAVLARAGLPGTPEFLTGKFGFFHNYCRDRFDLARATEGLGCRFEVERVSPKLYPSGRVTHGAVDAALALYHEAGVRPEEIKGITIRYSRLGYTMTCEPASERRYPTRAHHATFSLYYNVATALAHGRVDLDSFTDSAIADATTRAVSETIEVVIDESIHALLPIVMEARLTSGETITRTVTELAGSPESPASWARYLEKFYHCVDHAAVPIDAESREQMVKAASSLAEFSNLRVELLPALAGPSGADARREPGPESGARS